MYPKEAREYAHKLFMKTNADGGHAYMCPDIATEVRFKFGIDIKRSAVNRWTKLKNSDGRTWIQEYEGIVARAVGETVVAIEAKQNPDNTTKGFKSLEATLVLVTERRLTQAQLRQKYGSDIIAAGLACVAGTVKRAMPQVPTIFQQTRSLRLSPKDYAI
jgi:hypothetical protein